MFAVSRLRGLGVGLTAILAVLAPAEFVSAASARAADPAASEPEGFWTGPVNAPVPATITGGKVIHTRDLAALLKHDSHGAILIDVANAPRRPDNLPSTTAWLPVPHPGIPGALWIPGAGLGSLPAPGEQFLRQRLAAATGNDLGRVLIFYCHSRCWLSWNGAKRAIQYGYHHVFWYPEGIEGWRRAKLPTAVIQPQEVP
jgi:PQQ-dependent catabolism-associated CXXCW motif protein